MIGLAIACRSKTDVSDGNNNRSSVKTAQRDLGKGDIDLDDDDELEDEENETLSLRDNVAGEKVKGDGHTVDIQTKKNPVTDKTETHIKIQSDDTSKTEDKVTPTGPKTEETTTPGEESEDNETEEMTDKDKEAESSGDTEEDDNEDTEEDSAKTSQTEWDIESNCCNGWKWTKCFKPWQWRPFNRKRHYCKKPGFYKVSLINKKVDCCTTIVSNNRKVTRKSISRKRKAQDMAQAVGASINRDCDIRNVDVSYFKCRRSLFNWWRMGMKRMARKTCKGCDSSFCSKDRAAVVSFHRDYTLKNMLTLKRSNVLWKDFCETKLCNLTDLYKTKKKDENCPQYPKVGLKLIAKLHYMYDFKDDDRCQDKYCYRIKGTHGCLLRATTENAEIVTKEYKGKKYTILETCLKKFEYAGESHKKCNKVCGCRLGRMLGLKWLTDRIRARNGLIFVGKDNVCPPCETECGEKEKDDKMMEDECCNKSWSEIHSLRRKGNNMESYLWRLFKKPNFKAGPRRSIEIEKVKLDECGEPTNCVVSRCMALVDFVFAFEVQEKEGGEILRYEVEHNYAWS
ncbi:MAG: hypothetical protein GY830_09895 [Bacteroidetes bacterium]|nr:hypothetical protein [Bacteroidota bacterium]